MVKPVTFSPEALAAIVKAVQKELAAKNTAVPHGAGAGAHSGKGGLNAKSERSIKNEIAVVRAFKKAGFGNVKPHVDVKTFNRWMAEGMRPVEGSKSLKVKNLRLFHVSQVRVLTVEERTEAQAKSDAAVAEYDAKARENVVPIQ